MDVTGDGDLKDQASTVAGAADVDQVNLAQETKKKEFAKFDLEAGKHQQRWVMLAVIGAVFVALNAAVMWLIYYALGIDTVFTAQHPEMADKRLITSAVFQTLIGATVVQTGAVTWVMANFLFSKKID